MEDYFLHIINILEDGLQLRDICPLLAVAAGIAFKVYAGKKKVRN